MILYISSNFDNPASGGDHINKRNYDALEVLFKDQLLSYLLVDNYQSILLRCRFLRAIYIFLCSLGGYMLGYNIGNSKNILNILQRKNIDIVFISSSKYGKLVRQIKKYDSSIKVIVFFHNIEKQYYEEELKVNYDLSNLYWKYIVSKYEKLSSKYADYLILLNERDNDLLRKLYKRNANLLLPTSFVDNYNDFHPPIMNVGMNSPLRLLFVGMNFFANTEGIRWFIDKVLSQLDNVKLTIVGNGMDEVFSNSSSVEVYGYVNDLSKFYLDSDIVVIPIFSGGGMKTKTAEALMYGMPILGTVEAFMGYDFDYNEVGLCANSAEEMVMFLKEISIKRRLLIEYSKKSRDFFLKYYSFNNSVIKLKCFLDSIKKCD